MRIFSCDSMLRRNIEEWFNEYRFQTHMGGSSLWEKMGRRRFRDRRDRSQPIKTELKKKRKGATNMVRERLDCSK